MPAPFAVVTCHFNWQDYEMPKRNLHRFLRQMDRYGLPTYGIELFFSGRKPQTEGIPNWRQYRVNHQAVLWQKEALLNQVVQKLVPTDVEKIAFIDADIEFARHDWVNALDRALDIHPIAQPFERAHWTDREGKVCLTRTSVAMDHLDMRTWLTHPGFAWAMQRAFFDSINGWYDCAPMGAGDIALCFALEKRWPGDDAYARMLNDLGPHQQKRYDLWRSGVADALRGQTVGWTPGEVYHEWHGDHGDRNYNKRGKLIADFKVDRDLKKHHCGYWLWRRGANKTVKKNMSDYFAMRNEDGKN